MAIDTLKRALLFILFALAQALVFNHMTLFGCAMPLFYVYFVVIFPRRYPHWALLLWAFALGIVVDMFCNTPGVAAASMTLVGMAQPYLLEAFIPRDAVDTLEASARTLTWGKFFTYSLLLVLLYCIAYFLLESFNFFDWIQLLLNIGGSTVLTMLLIMTFESVRKS